MPEERITPSAFKCRSSTRFCEFVGSMNPLGCLIASHPEKCCSHWLTVSMSMPLGYGKLFFSYFLSRLQRFVCVLSRLDSLFLVVFSNRLIVTNCGQPCAPIGLYVYRGTGERIMLRVISRLSLCAFFHSNILRHRARLPYFFIHRAERKCVTHTLEPLKIVSFSLFITCQPPQSKHGIVP